MLVISFFLFFLFIKKNLFFRFFFSLFEVSSVPLKKKKSLQTFVYLGSTSLKFGEQTVSESKRRVLAAAGYGGGRKARLAFETALNSI